MTRVGMSAGAPVRQRQRVQPLTLVVGTRGNARNDPEQRASPHLTAALRTPLCGKQILPTASSKSAAPRMMSISKRR